MAKVSVNIACYNSAPFIAATIESVLAQEHTDLEVIVIDDGSTDDTGSIVRSFSDSRIRYFRKENEGLSATRNKGLALSSGAYIAFLDHDDIWAADKLAKQVRILETDGSVGIVYSNFYRDYPDGRQEVALRGRQPSGDVFGRFLHSYPVGLSTVVARKEFLEGLGDVFDPCFKIAEDYDVIMRLAYRHKVSYIDEPLVRYRMHDRRATLAFRDRYADEYESAVEKLKRLDPSVAATYRDALRSVDGKIRYLRGKIMMDRRDFAAARRYLTPFALTNARCFLLLALAYLPPLFWERVSASRNGGFVL